MAWAIPWTSEATDTLPSASVMMYPPLAFLTLKLRSADGSDMVEAVDIEGVWSGRVVVGSEEEFDGLADSGFGQGEDVMDVGQEDEAFPRDDAPLGSTDSVLADDDELFLLLDSGEEAALGDGVFLPSSLDRLEHDSADDVAVRRVFKRRVIVGQSQAKALHHGGC